MTQLHSSDYRSPSQLPEGPAVVVGGGNTGYQIAEELVRSREVPAAMVRAFEADPAAPLASRLVASLQAGDAAGGEFKPLVSAALLVADREAFPFVDLRVDQDGAPIAALARLWQEYAPMAEPYVARAVDPDSAQAL